MSSPIAPKKRTTIYIDTNLWNEFGKVCEREGTKRSPKIESFIARHVAVHMKGNPQLRLEKFIGEIKKKCFRCEGFFPSLQKVEFVSGWIASECPECLKMDRERGVVKKVLGII